MRFFPHRLSPMYKSISNRSLFFPLKPGILTYILISDDLTNLKIRCRLPNENQNKKIKNALLHGLNDLPIQPHVNFEDGVFVINHLFDISLQLKTVIETLKKEDPIFLLNLDHWLNEDETKLTLETMTASPLRATYFCLQAQRSSGVQHAVELPLKSLQQENLINQNELNEMIEKVWLRTNMLRKVVEKDISTLPEPGNIPRVFSL